MPYGLGRYKITCNGKSVILELEDMEVQNARAGDARLQRSIAVSAKGHLNAGWVTFSDLEIQRIDDAETKSGCGCDCYRCDQLSAHCRNHSSSCYI